jgi:HAD superfamily hydrolase (TIGR01662 family)
VARGYFDEAFVETVHDRIQTLLRQHGARIDRFYYCPHHPTEGIGVYRMACACRKPEAGLLLQASQEMGIELTCSYMVGDMSKDIEAAGKAGVKGIFVQTGHGMGHLGSMKSGMPPRTKKSFPPGSRPEGSVKDKEALTSPLERRKAFDSPPADPFSSARPDYIAGNILDAVTWIMKDREK